MFANYSIFLFYLFFVMKQDVEQIEKLTVTEFEYVIRKYWQIKKTLSIIQLYLNYSYRGWQI